MADSPAVRQRRHRQHANGDHTLCGPRCTPGDRPEPRTDLADAVKKYLATSAAGPYDETLDLEAAILVRAAEAADQAPTPGMIRVLDNCYRAYARTLRATEIGINSRYGDPSHDIELAAALGIDSQPRETDGNERW